MSSPVQAPGGMQPVSRPAWEWRTFPVYFAFAAGGFIGLYMGLIAGLAGDTPFTYVAFTFWAILLGFGFSRITSRWMMNRGWGRRIQRTGKR
jgi:hypothetical protein